ncbi:MAG TPA: zinc-binding alcohol dehydrogenase [Gaiellaceae bacterium]
MAQAVWFAGPRRAELREEAVKPPGRDEIEVAGLFSLVSAGTELNFYRGLAVSAEETALPMGAGSFPFPLKYGYQVVGRVERVGAGAPFAVGDTVFAFHPHQDRFTIPSEFVFPLPPDIEPRKATFANLLTVALNGFLDAPARIGDVVVVSGLGIVGTFCAHLARRTARTLILVDPVAERRALAAAAVDADAAIGPAELHEALAALSKGRGADLYIEASGAPAALQTAIEETGMEGTIVVLSYYANKNVSLTLAPQFHIRRQKILGSQVGRIGWGLDARWDMARRFDVATHLLRDLDTTPMITNELPLERAPEAYVLLDEHPEDVLGVLLAY